MIKVAVSVICMLMIVYKDSQKAIYFKKMSPKQQDS